VFSQLGRWRELKQRKESVVIGVGGCVASQEGAAIVKRAPYVDLVFGPQTLHRLPQMIDAHRATGCLNAPVDLRSSGPRFCEPRAPIFTRFLYHHGNSIRVAYASAFILATLQTGVRVMDVVYLFLLAILIGLSAGYLLLCAWLEDHR